MSEDAADVLREAIDGERTASDAWEDQQLVNEAITSPSTEVIDAVLADDSRIAELTAAIVEVVESRSEKSNV